MSEPTERLKLEPGWYVQLRGEDVDLSDWVRTLNAPFDPVAVREPDGTVILMSSEYQGLTSAEEVRERALSLIARLNGSMSLMHDAGSVELNSVFEVNEAGGRSHHVTFASAVLTLGRISVSATAVLLDSEGRPLPPAPPQPSAAQAWIELSENNDDVADLLEELGRAKDWYGIYKAIELAEDVVGNKHGLEQMAGGPKSDFAMMRRTANFYRHARADKPPRLIELRDAFPILRWIVRLALDPATTKLAAREGMG